jgi:hypothetical protein
VLCPFWLPLVALGGAAFGEAGGVIGLGYSAVLWFLLDYVVLRGDSRQAAPTPESAVER